MAPLRQLVLCQLTHPTMRTFETQHETALHLIFHPGQVFGIDPVRTKFLQFTAHDFYHTLHLFGPRACVDRGHAPVRVRGQERID